MKNKGLNKTKKNECTDYFKSTIIIINYFLNKFLDIGLFNQLLHCLAPLNQLNIFSSVGLTYVTSITIKLELIIRVLE